MLDKRGMALLKTINSLCDSSGYKILEISFLAQNIPLGFCFSNQDVVAYIEQLVDKQLISVRYQDENEICLSLTPKGRMLFESATDEQIKQKQASKHFFIYSFLGAVLGGLVGGIILLLVFSGVR